MTFISRRILLKEADYGWVAGEIIKLRLSNNFSKKIIYTQKEQYTAEEWLQTGLLMRDNSVNDGAPESGRIIPFEKSGCFFEAGVLAQGQPPSGAISTNNWTQAEADRLANWLKLYRPYKYNFSSLDEDYTGLGAVSSVTNPELFRMVEYAIATAYSNSGALYFASYAGLAFCYLNTAQQIGNARAACLSTVTALTQLRQGGNLNHRSNPAWEPASAGKPQMLDKMHVCYQIYWIYAPGDSNPFREYTKAISNAIHCRNALTQMGNTVAKLFAFAWLPSTQVAFDAFGVTVTRDVPAGGQVITHDFPGYPFACALELVLDALDFADGLIAWEDGKVYNGSDPNRVPNETTIGNNESVVHYTGGNAQRADPQYFSYKLTDPRAPYPRVPYGNNDALKVGAEWFDYMEQWSGSTFSFYPIKKAGAANFSPGTKDDHLTALENHTEFCRVAKSNKNYSIRILTNEPAPCHVEINLGSDGVWKTADLKEKDGSPMAPLCPGTPYCFLVKVN